MTTFEESIDRRRLAAAPPAPGDLATDEIESISARNVALMRFVLALSALVVMFIDPAETARFVVLTRAALLIYTVYSAVLYLSLVRTGATRSSAAPTWIDVGSYVVLMALSGGTGSVFFFLFIFSILVAAFRGGYESGLRVTLVSASLFTFVGYATPAQNEFELNRFLLRVICLLVLGYMIAVWGGSELMLRRRLALLKSISGLANPRFGVDQTLGTFMESVRRFYDADTCLLVSQNPETQQYALRRADRYKADRAVIAERVTGEIGCQLGSLLGDESVAVTSAKRRGRRPRTRVLRAGYERDDSDGARLLPVLDGLARLIGDESYMSVPWRQSDGTAARLYVASRAGKFDRGQLEFLRQVVAHATPLIENIQLLDRLASTAAEQERRRISRDLHDSTIQPYIGLKMGLESIRRKAAADNPLAGDLGELAMTVEIGLSELRRYVHGLKGEDPEPSEPVISSAVREYAEEFTRLYGVDVTCEVEPGLMVNDRLAAEALQIVREGLSNVRRHTAAGAAAVSLCSRGRMLTVEVINEAARAAAPFTPRSIKERAEALGGKAQVVAGDGLTVVRAVIPL
ncbi:MAG TPA: histidine kinase [Pyrinomonadaceae bacterium]|jgi:signal transduction histidine kinase|nr:histidine kinase [Pyrinomonadaceae bacterium]